MFTDYNVGPMIAEGEKGAVFDVVYSDSANLKSSKCKLVCKITTDHEALKKEIRIIKAARKFSKVSNSEKNDGPIPKIVNNGVFELELSDSVKTKLSFMVMKKYDYVLVDYL